MAQSLDVWGYNPLAPIQVSMTKQPGRERSHERQWKTEDSREKWGDRPFLVTYPVLSPSDWYWEISSLSNHVQLWTHQHINSLMRITSHDPITSPKPRLWVHEALGGHLVIKHNSGTPWLLAWRCNSLNIYFTINQPILLLDFCVLAVSTKNKDQRSEGSVTHHIRIQLPDSTNISLLFF